MPTAARLSEGTAPSSGVSRTGEASLARSLAEADTVVLAGIVIERFCGFGATPVLRERYCGLISLNWIMKRIDPIWTWP